MCAVIVSAVLLCYLSTSSHLDFLFSQHALVMSAKTKTCCHLTQSHILAVVNAYHYVQTPFHSQSVLTVGFWRWAFVLCWRSICRRCFVLALCCLALRCLALCVCFVLICCCSALCLLGVVVAYVFCGVMLQSLTNTG